MALPVVGCPKFLGLLDEFYRGRAEQAPFEATLVPPEQVPEPQRSLLVHANDMTSTLARFHREPVALRTLERRVRDQTLARHIVLVGAESGRPVEYGAIRIRLDRLDEPARSEALACRKPLGGILAAHGIAFACCPGGFFRLRSNEVMEWALALEEPAWLYGRCNCLSDPSGQPIAEVVEVLPPER